MQQAQNLNIVKGIAKRDKLMVIPEDFCGKPSSQKPALAVDLALYFKFDQISQYWSLKSCAWQGHSLYNLLLKRGQPLVCCLAPRNTAIKIIPKTSGPRLQTSGFYVNKADKAVVSMINKTEGLKLQASFPSVG